jgi:hypothetical protein
MSVKLSKFDDRKRTGCAESDQLFKRARKDSRSPSYFRDYQLFPVHHQPFPTPSLLTSPSPQLPSYNPVFYRLFQIQISVEYVAQTRIDPSCQQLLQQCWSQLKVTQTANTSFECNQYIKCIEDSREDGSDPWTQKYDVRWINESVGYGLFAKTVYKKNEVIGVYTGYLTSQAQNKEYVFQWTDPPYENRICIDGLQQGNATRFMNHAATKIAGIKNRACNASSVEFFYNGLPYVIFITDRKVNPDEQLCYDYGAGYWEQRDITPINFGSLQRSSSTTL